MGRLARSPGCGAEAFPLALESATEPTRRGQRNLATLLEGLAATLVRMTDDGSTVLTADRDPRARLRDTRTAASGPTLDTGAGWIESVALSPDGRIMHAAAAEEAIPSGEC